MTTEQSTELCWLLTPETLQDRRSLHSIRCDNGLVSIYDVIRWVTGQQLKACQTIWARLLTAYPNMSTSCGSIKFTPRGRGRPAATPAADAAGIVQIIMVLPGRAADQFRQAASRVIVRYLGGDPRLVQEIWANRRYQEELAASQLEPAGVFAVAEGAEKQTQRQLTEARIALTRAQARKVEQETKLVTLQCAALAEELCCEQGFPDEWPAMIARAAVNAVLPG